MVLSLPDTHFLYAKDGGLEEVWFIYDSAGNIITTSLISYSVSTFLGRLNIIYLLIVNFLSSTRPPLLVNEERTSRGGGEDEERHKRKRKRII